MHNSSVKWGHLGNFDPNSTNTISLFFIIIITLIVSWCLENKYNQNFKGI